MSLFLRCFLLLLISLLPGMASSEDKFFNSNGVRIRYVDHGTGEPVVLVHGYTSVIERAWIETGVLPNLAKDHRVIALDLRGHGKSDKPHDSKAYVELGQDVVRLLNHLNITRAHIVGYSLGGVITAKLLTTNPDRFITSTLGGSSGRRSWTDKDERDAEAAAAELEGGVPYRSLILATAPTDQPPPTEEAIRKRSQQIVATNDPLAHAALVRARRELVVNDSQMAAVWVPTLAVVGSADRALTGVNALKAVWLSLKVVVLQDAVHSSRRTNVGLRVVRNSSARFGSSSLPTGEARQNERHFQANCRLKPVRSSRKEEDTVTVTKDRPILVLTVSLPKRR